MLLRDNPCYSPMFRCDRSGLLIVTKGWIFATRTYARTWA